MFYFGVGGISLDAPNNTPLSHLFFRLTCFLLWEPWGLVVLCFPSVLVDDAAAARDVAVT
jgi:hypothetical protein